MNSDVILEAIFRGEGFVAHFALEFHRRSIVDPVNDAFVMDQITSLEKTVTADFADETLLAEVTSPMVLELVFRHKSLFALLAFVPIDFLVNTFLVHHQGHFVRGTEAADVAGVHRAAVDLAVHFELVRSLESFLTDVALVRFLVAVLEHVLLVGGGSGEAFAARNTLEIWGFDFFSCMRIHVSLVFPFARKFVAASFALVRHGRTFLGNFFRLFARILEFSAGIHGRAF